ncbi:TlpA family protein disulfide reductase [Chitinophaga caseinilytica]|uniref:TlpA family protein disulfide reductase n=1 Tax=Chitinophaga caseinilytica TaxID=2267521 RepID=UPI003C2CA0C4
MNKFLFAIWLIGCGFQGYAQPAGTDTAAFGPLRFREDSITIIGTYKNFRFSPGSYFKVSYQDWVTAREVTFSAPIDEAGKFRIRFPLPVETQLFIDYDRLYEVNLGIPGETVYLQADMNNYQVPDSIGGSYRKSVAWLGKWSAAQYKGTHAKMHNEILAWHRHQARLVLPDYPDGTWEPQFPSTQVYLDTMAGIFRGNMKDFSSYAKSRKLESRTRQYIEANIRYDVAYALTQSYYSIARSDKQAVFPAYFTTTDTIASLRHGAPYLTRNYIVVLRDIRGHSQSHARKLKLDPDSAYRAWVRHPIEYDLTTTWLASQAFKAGKTLDETALSKLRSQVKEPFLLQKVTERNEAQKAIEANEKLLAGTRLITEFPHLKSAEEIFQHITSPYRGKVIYLDVWGTWCGPCIEMFQYMPAIKKQYAEKDVVFIYLANHTPETAWKNAIKLHGITGANVVHYRMPETMQAMFEKGYQLRTFPSFLLIDRDGKLVTGRAPWPRHTENLHAAINKLL